MMNRTTVIFVVIVVAVHATRPATLWTILLCEGHAAGGHRRISAGRVAASGTGVWTGQPLARYPRRSRAPDLQLRARRRDRAGTAL